MLPCRFAFCRFDLAIQLGDLQIAADIANKLDTPAKWKQLGELALSRGQLELASDCLTKAKDMSGLLLMAAAKVSLTLAALLGMHLLYADWVFVPLNLSMMSDHHVALQCFCH